MFSVFGVGADFPIEAWLEMSDQGEALSEFLEEDIGVWVLYGLQQVVEEWYLRDHRRLSVGLLAMVWQVLVPFMGLVGPFAHEVL